MDIVPSKFKKLELAFQEIFSLASASLTVQTENLNNIIKLEQDGDTLNAYDILLKYAKSRFPLLEQTTRVDPSILQAPIVKSVSLIALEKEVRSLFIRCALVEAQILKGKSHHLGLILELAKLDLIEQAYNCLIRYCKMYQYK